jgi:hypothetical protein
MPPLRATSQCLELAQRRFRVRLSATDAVAQAMLHVILDQLSLGVADRVFDGMDCWARSRHERPSSNFEMVAAR